MSPWVLVLGVAVLAWAADGLAVALGFLAVVALGLLVRFLTDAKAVLR